MKMNKKVKIDILDRDCILFIWYILVFDISYILMITTIILDRDLQ